MRRQRAIAFLAFLAIAVPGGCGFGSGPVWDDLQPIARPVVERLGERSVRVRWPVSFSIGAVSVYMGTSPRSIDRDEPAGRSWGLPRSVTVTRLDPSKRYYFELVEESSGKSRVVAERRLPLEGTDNFRDIGGYEAEGKHFVEWGLLYRSNNLSDLTGDDIRYLTGLGIQLVCDFRSAAERAREPDREIGAGDTETAELTIAVEGVDPGAMQERIRTGRLSADSLEQVMLAAYRSFVTDHSEQFAAMFDRILQTENLPTIVHCTAGKDRTGFASAMVLLALGVPRETVFEDYMATNRYRAGYKKWITRLVPIYSLFRTRGADIEPLLDARRPYLQASLDTIEERYGSVPAYLEQGLGVSPEEQVRLREIFLR
jgi:protein-tyrosine phosphatase